MNKFIKLVIVNFSVLVMLISQMLPVIAVNFSQGDKILLEKDHDCISLLKIKGSNMMKGVTFVVYKNLETNEKQPAFCVEPEKEGIGTGAGDSYDVTLSSLEDERLWRILYKGFMGSSYQDWNLESEDDLYYATKTAVHSLVQDISPVDKYEEPIRVGYGEDISFEDVLRRRRKVLEVAQKLYEYGVNGEEKYKKPQMEIIEQGEEEKEIDGKMYLVKKYEVEANRKLDGYLVKISNMPKGTIILENDVNNNKFKIAIPEENITENISGKIEIVNAKIKTYPVFYAEAYNEEMQDYITYTSNYEEINSERNIEVDAYKSRIIVNKIDGETKEKLEGVEFKLLNDQKEEIGTFITDGDGKIFIEKLKPGKYYLKESKNLDEYYELKNEIEIEIKWNEQIELNVANELKKGKAQVIKVNKENNEETIEGAQFEVSDEDGNILEIITTNAEGVAETKEYELKKYRNLFIREIYVPDEYILDEEQKKVELSEEKISKVIFENTKADIKVDIDKKGKVEAKSGEVIEYTFSNIENKSNVRLENFTWTDYIPTNAVRVQKLNTGIWNENGKYSIWYKTNKEKYKMFKDDLDTKINNEIEFNEIKLDDDEYITEYQLRFHDVKVGFKEESNPKLYCKVLDNLENDFEFINNTEIIGTYRGKSVNEKSEWKTIIYTPKEPKKILPRTGK